MAKDFPIASEGKAAAHPLRIPWNVAELAYSVYRSKYGSSQSLERLAERGGFYPSEMDEFLPDWRERSSEEERLRRERDIATEALVGMDVIERGTRGGYAGDHFVRENLRKALDGAEWLREHVENFERDSMLFATAINDAAELAGFIAKAVPYNSLPLRVIGILDRIRGADAAKETDRG
jgi:hypothetical protein